MDDITVWCVCVGDKYHTGYVHALNEMVEKNLTIPHEFRCITTHKIDGIHCVLPYAPYQGWWAKANLFAPRIATGPSLYFDLDVTIEKNIDYLADYTDTFSAPANWGQSGHGGIQSSVMAWPGNWTEPFEYISSQWPQISDRLWGDQEALWEMLGDNWQRIEGIGSYKYHIRPKGEVPDWMHVCVYHGNPKPDKVTDPCLSSTTQIIRNHTRLNMANGSRPGLSGMG